MRSIAFLSLMTATALIPAAADSATGTAPAGGWGPVPAVALHPPMAAPAPPPVRGNWGPGGWHEGQAAHGGGRHWGNWAQGGAYRRPFPGQRVSRFYVAPEFFVTDWPAYGLQAPGYGQGWYRYYDDAVLADGDGMVYDRRGGVDWDRYDHGPVPEYVGRGDEDRGPGPREGWRDDDVTWGWHPPIGAAPAMVYRAPPGTTTTVVIQSAPVVTRTTYVEEKVVYARKKVWKPRARVRWHAPACGCGCVCRGS